jgi:hypothetical protein
VVEEETQQLLAGATVPCDRKDAPLVNVASAETS